jgi:hypothetical protein
MELVQYKNIYNGSALITSFLSLGIAVREWELGYCSPASGLLTSDRNAIRRAVRYSKPTILQTAVALNTNIWH